MGVRQRRVRAFGVYMIPRFAGGSCPALGGGFVPLVFGNPAHPILSWIKAKLKVIFDNASGKGKRRRPPSCRAAALRGFALARGENNPPLFEGAKQAEAPPRSSLARPLVRLVGLVVDLRLVSRVCLKRGLSVCVLRRVVRRWPVRLSPRRGGPCPDVASAIAPRLDLGLFCWPSPA